MFPLNVTFNVFDVDGVKDGGVCPWTKSKFNNSHRKIQSEETLLDLVLRIMVSICLGNEVQRVRGPKYFRTKDVNQRRNRNLGEMKSSTEALGSFTPAPKLRLEYKCNASELLHCVLLLSGTSNLLSSLISNLPARMK